MVCNGRRGEDRVALALRKAGVRAKVATMPESTRTASDAAAVVGCDVSEIVKSLVFRRSVDDRPILVLVSGADRVDLDHLAAVVGGPVEQATAKYVRARTGFVIGGVPPLGHDEPLDTYMDERLVGLTQVWAAAGGPNSVFAIEVEQLLKATAARVVSVAVRPSD